MAAPAYLIAQISDLHIKGVGRLAYGLIDTAAYARAAVDAVNALDPQPDLVLVTGDLVDGGRVDEYRHLADLLGPVRPPLRLVAGNHDDRDHLREVFAGYDDGPWLQYVVDGPVRTVVLDSSRPPAPGGRLAADQLAWLDESLSAAPSTPTVVAVHHPPFTTGIDHMDAMGLDLGDADAFGAVIERHGQVERVICGHLHRSITRRWRGTIALTSPGVAHAVSLDLRSDTPAAWTREPPALLLHTWRPDSGLVTHLSPIGDFPATPFAS